MYDTETLCMAAAAVLKAWDLEDTRNHFTTHPDGWALLALLCNARAKTETHLYTYKAPLVYAAIQHAEPGTWWVDTHAHGDYGNAVVFLETRFGQLAFHFSELPDWLTNAPSANGRRWSGVPLQPHAYDLALEWLAQGDARFRRVGPVMPHTQPSCGIYALTFPLYGPHGLEECTVVDAPSLATILAFQRLHATFEHAVDAWLLTADAQRSLLVR